MEIREIRDVKGLRAIEEPWHRLVEGAGGDCPYDTPAFLLPWLEAAGGEYSLRVLTAWQGDELVALAPLVTKTTRKLGVSVHVLSLPIHGETPPFQLVIARDRPAVVAAFVEHGMRGAPCHLVRLQHLDGDSSTVEALRRAALAGGLRFESVESRRTYHVPVETDWDTYLAGRSKNLRRTLRRGRRFFEQLGRVELRRYPDGETTQERAKEMAFEAMEHSWKDIRRSRGPWAQLPMTLADSLDRRGMLSLRFLLVDGKPVAYLYEIDYRNTVHAFHSAYDSRYQAGSPGALLIEDAIRSAHDRKLTRYDFTGKEPYLRAWADVQTVSCEVRLTPRTASARIKSALYLRVHTARKARARQGTRNFRDSVKRLGRGQPPRGPR